MLEGIAPVVLQDQVWSVNILDRFPGVVAFGVPFPFHKVLEGSRPSMTSMVDQVFDLVFLSALDKVRWRSREIRAVYGVLMIGEK